MARILKQPLNLIFHWLREGRLYERPSTEGLIHTSDLVSFLRHKAEIQGIGLPVNEFHTYLTTGARPGLFGLPDIGVNVGRWIVAQRA